MDKEEAHDSAVRAKQDAVEKLWSILWGNFENNADDYVKELKELIDAHARTISAYEASNILTPLHAIGKDRETNDLCKAYIGAQNDKPRKFFADTLGAQASHEIPIHPQIKIAFEEKLKSMPLTQDPAVLLIKIYNNSGWDPDDVAYLATVEVKDYVAMLKHLRDDELEKAIHTALRIGNIYEANPNYNEVANRMQQALRQIGEENEINQFRVQRYLKQYQLKTDSETEEQQPPKQ